jgi:hypothetical protein
MQKIIKAGGIGLALYAAFVSYQVCKAIQRGKREGYETNPLIGLDKGLL